MRDVANEIFFTVAGFFCLMAPLFKNTVGNWLVFLVGCVFISALLVTYFVGRRCDKKFRDIFFEDENLGSKLSLSFLPPQWYLSFELTRACMYARNIAFPKNSAKNPIQYSWFQGYDFRKRARVIDFFASYTLIASILILAIFAITLFAFQLFT